MQGQRSSVENYSGKEPVPVKLPPDGVAFTNPQDSAAATSSIVGYPAHRHLRSSHGLLPTSLPLFSRLLQLPIPLGMDLLLTPGEHVLRRDVADGTVQADVVVMLQRPGNGAVRVQREVSKEHL